MSLLPEDFLRFLKEYGVVGLALAVVIGTAVKELVDAVVDGAVMPVIGVALPGEEWRAAVYTLAGIEFEVGHIVGATLDFVIIAVLVYLFVRHALKQETVEKV